MTFADLIVVNARIVTIDPFLPEAKAMAVKDGRIIALGEWADLRLMANSQTQIVDAAGNLVLPGFQDTHIHLLEGGQADYCSADLLSVTTVEEMQAALADHAAANPGEWVKGAGWNSGYFGAANLNRHVLDQVVPDRPCFTMASDGHNACLNTRACEVIGLIKGTPDPANGHFVQEADGTPSGLLYEDAIFWALDRMPALIDGDYQQGVRHGQKLANRHGFTGVLDASVYERHTRVYAQLEEAGELTVRVSATARVDANEVPAQALERVSAIRAAHQSDMFKVHSAKFFLDGVFENRTAAMIEPYADAKGGNAELMFSREQIMEFFPLFDAARFQLHIHAIGDEAVRAGLDGMEAARRQNGQWPGLHQIAHVQVIDPADIPRFFELGVMPNLQPLWAQVEPSITDMVQPMIGPERSRYIYANRSLIDAGATCALSSDWSVSTLNPFQIMETAITRQPPGEPHHPVLMPEQRMTREEALRGYTINAARAAWNAEKCGSLSLGKYADFIIIDQDILDCDVYEIGKTEVLLTVLGGVEVYRREGFES